MCNNREIIIKKVLNVINEFNTLQASNIKNNIINDDIYIFIGLLNNEPFIICDKKNKLNNNFNSIIELNTSDFLIVYNNYNNFINAYNKKIYVIF